MSLQNDAVKKNKENDMDWENLQKNIIKRIKFEISEYSRKHNINKSDFFKSTFNTISDESITYSRQALAKCDTNSSIPSLAIMIKMCKIFDCDLDYLVCRIDERHCIADAVLKLTGLSENAINILKKDKQSNEDYDYSVFNVLSTLIENKEGQKILDILYQYINEYILGNTFNEMQIPEQKWNELYDLYSKSLLPDITVYAEQLKKKARIDYFNDYISDIPAPVKKEYKKVIEKNRQDFCDFKISAYELDKILWTFKE